MYLTTKNIRRKFLDFFIEKNHENTTNTEITINKDPTLLFINAGMVPFKELFLDCSNTQYSNKVSAQRCIRIGGKQSDLNNVGLTKYHHTFFEMLGNFSFGDYSKELTIRNSWYFLTTVLNICKDNLFITIHPEDHIALSIWANLVPNKKQIIEQSTNFWSMGDTGPCGYCSEIFYTKELIENYTDTTINITLLIDKSVELWNLVFIAFNKTKQNKLLDLSRKSIDTGMGLERIAYVLQDVENTYETDLFKNALTALKKKTQEKYNRVSSYIIVDHLRCCVILIDKNIIPAGTKRGYILKKLLHIIFEKGYDMGLTYNFTIDLLKETLLDLKETDIEINNTLNIFEDIIKKEEMSYVKKEEKSYNILKKILKDKKILDGLTIYNLYETYGIRIEYLKKISAQFGVTLEMESYNTLLLEDKKHNREIKKKYNNNYHNRDMD